MQITKVNCPQSKYDIKCPYEMIPEGITVHNTANDASAMSEISYMLGNDRQVSFHAAVDDYRIVQGIDENRNTWHSGDGFNGYGNRKTIAIEICYSKSGGERFEKAEELAAEYIASLLKKYGWGIERVGKHQDRNQKYCPHRTLDLGWDRFLDMIKAHLNSDTAAKEEPTPITPSQPKTAHSVGENVKYNKIFASSSSTTGLKPVYNTGTITKVVVGARNPYLVGNGTGWINDACIEGATVQTKSIDELAREVIAGKWGNGQERKDRLTNAGYNYKEVQNRVNELLK